MSCVPVCFIPVCLKLHTVYPACCCVQLHIRQASLIHFFSWPLNPENKVISPLHSIPVHGQAICQLVVLWLWLEALSQVVYLFFWPTGGTGSFHSEEKISASVKAVSVLQLKEKNGHGHCNVCNESHFCLSCVYLDPDLEGSLSHLQPVQVSELTLIFAPFGASSIRLLVSRLM